MIKFSCKNCGQKLNVEDKHAGRQVKCPKCAEVMSVPAVPDKISFQCKSCSQKISVPAIHAGKKGKCPKCQNIVTIPDRKARPAASRPVSSIPQQTFQDQYQEEYDETQESEGVSTRLVLMIAGAALVLIVGIIIFAVFLRSSGNQPDISYNRQVVDNRNTQNPPVTSNTSPIETASSQKNSAQQAAQAETLLAGLPDNMLGFVFTSGMDNLRAGFEKTMLSQIWNDPGVQSFYQSILSEAWPKLNQQIAGSGFTGTLDVVKNFMSLAAARPIVIGVVQNQTQGSLPVIGFAILDAGTHKDEINKSLAELESLAGQGEIVDIDVGSVKMHSPKETGGVPGYWGWIGNYLVFAINDGEGIGIKNLQEKVSRSVPSYLQDISGKDNIFAVYLDREKSFQLLFDSINGMQGNNNTTAIIASAIKELGLDNIKTLVSHANFEGNDIVVNTFLDVQQPRTGLFKHFNAIKPDIFNMVDARAVNATALNCSFAGIYDTIMSIIAKAAGPNSSIIEKQISNIETQLNLKIRQGLLESLSGEMVFYTLQGDVTAQPPQGGMVLIAKLKDAKLWEQSLSAAEKFASQNKNINNLLQTGTQVINGKTCHVWGVMPLAVAGITPTWVITNDTFVLTSNPQLCIQAVSHVESGTNSLGNTESFKKYASNLPENLLTLRYADSKTQFNQAMMGMQQSWPAITMAVANSGIKLPVTLPSVTNITQKMEPSFQYRWSDDKGFHSYYRGPGIEPSLTTIAAGSLGLGILMPALARTKQTAEQIDTLKNLSVIGKAMLIYADRNADLFPPTLHDLSKVGGLDPKIFESKRKPADFAGPAYIYITGQTTSYDPRNILVYENPAYCADGVNVLYLDSHVKFLKKEDFLKELKATYQRLRKPMPEIKFKD